MIVKVLCLLVLTVNFILAQDEAVYKVGAIFYKDEAEDLKTALELGARNFELSTSVKEMSKSGEVLELQMNVCALAEEGVVGIIDGIGGRASEHIQALCDILEIPHVMIQHNDLYAKNWSFVNLYPSPDAFNTVLQSIIEEKDWKNFTILYVKGHPVSRVSQLLEMGNSTDKYTVGVRELSGDDYRDVLTNAKESGFYNFVVDCQSMNLEQLLTHAQQVGLVADEHSYIFVSPDIFTLDLERFRYGGVNLTGLRLVNLQNSEYMWDFTAKFNEETGKELNPEDFKTKVLLVYDAMKVFNESIKKVSNLKAESLYCDKYLSWNHGSSLLNFMKTNKVEGVTRTLMFDGLGQRNDVIFDVLELTPSGNQSVGSWMFQNLTVNRPFVPSTDLGGGSIMRNKTFKVLISMTPPHGYMTESHVELEGNSRYEGFSIDLIEKLSDILEFNFEFEVEKDYGSINPETKQWTGMTLALMEERADFAICDFTITAQRKSAIDFSTPFMTLGLGILYKEPSKQPPEMFSFMAVFSKEVWYYMMFVQLGIGIIMIFVGRISHKEWQNPVPCIEQPEELSNQFSFANSVWLIIGSVMQQGSEIAPIALAPRMITSFWWFFTMVMVASYVGTLVAFLTVENEIKPFNNIQELHDHPTISYGAKKQGSTIDFFKGSSNAMYRSMYDKMMANKWLVDNNDIAVERAEKQTFAVFMESTSIEYYIERHCDLIRIGGLLDSKSYGIGMKKGSPYKRDIDDALLKLKEKGEIQKLKDTWWKEKRGGGKCGIKATEDPKKLGMKNMLGAFVVLGAGCGFGVIISILDMLWGVFKRSVKYGTTFKYEFIEEIKFTLKFSGDVKPVKRPPKSGDGSAEALADDEAEGKDELGSLRSARTVRSGRSTSTHRSHHSHSSRHSSTGLSIAFARRREYS